MSIVRILLAVFSEQKNYGQKNFDCGTKRLIFLPLVFLSSS
jgi:hypothetical protein